MHGAGRVNMKQKAFFIIFKGLLAARNCLKPKSRPLAIFFKKTPSWIFNRIQNPEAATRDVLRKKVFLEVSQNSQENTCAWVPFLIKLQASGFQLY